VHVRIGVAISSAVKEPVLGGLGTSREILVVENVPQNGKHSADKGWSRADINMRISARQFSFKCLKDLCHNKNNRLHDMASKFLLFLDFYAGFKFCH
jgi:hypothetical protein